MIIEPTKKTNSRYLQKAKSSFKSRFDLLLYSRIVNNIDGEITTNDLEGFIIDEHSGVLDEYIHVYWQQELEFDINGHTIQIIYDNIVRWIKINKPNIDMLQKHYVDNIFPSIFPYDAFVQMIENEKECNYCHITEEKIADLLEKRKLNKKHITRGWSLEIDRKRPNHEYTEENCVMCCYWCNNAKTDEFSHEDFLKIGRQIESIWNERLNGK